MPAHICHHNGKYNIYTSVSDGFYWESGLTLEQLQEWIKDDQGEQGLDKLPDRLKRAHEKGTSSMLDDSLEDMLCCNRAGENEEHIAYEECLKRFFK